MAVFERYLSPIGGESLSEKYRDELLQKFPKAYKEHAENAGRKKVYV